MVDLPQHLHLISVLHRLDDPSTLYPAFFERRGELTPYLGYYYAVEALHQLLPLELANRIFLSLYVLAFPLSVAFLLRSLGRPRWPALLTVPLAYGDNFGWGFVNYCASTPLAILGCGLSVRLLKSGSRRTAAALAITLVAALLFHVQAYFFLAVGLPVLFFMTRGPSSFGLPNRLTFTAAAVPSAALFVVWFGARLGQPTEVQYGAPWKAWGPMLSPQNLAFRTFRQNLDDALPLLANLLRDHSDFYAFLAVGAVGTAAAVLAIWPRFRPPELGNEERGRERWRLAALATLAWVFYFALPFDIRGYIYYLNPRYAQLAAAFTLAAVPSSVQPYRRWLCMAAAGTSTVFCLVLAQGFLAFGRESRALEELSKLVEPQARVMGLIFDPNSEVVRQPVYLHAAATVAREAGGVANFSFALTPHSPVRYRVEPPPTFPSEWRPDRFSYPLQGPAYDHFVGRGGSPESVFGPLIGTDLEWVDRLGSFWMLRRKAPAGISPAP